MDKSVIIWRHGEPMQKSKMRPIQVSERIESTLQHGEDSRIANNFDLSNKREMMLTKHVEYSSVASNPFFADVKFADVVSKQDNFMRGRPK
jgi:hypothetical protein